MARLGRASAIIIKENKILLIHRKKEGKEYWVLPGGGIDEPETAEQAIVREVKEETNLEATEVKKYLTDSNWGEVFYVQVSEGTPEFVAGPEMDKDPNTDWYSPEWVDLSEKEKLVLFEHLLLGVNTDTWTSEEGLVHTFTWIKDDDVSDYKPVTQVYGICFNEKGEILVHSDAGSAWGIPGGTPEEGENFEETLRRELLEEVDVEVEKCIPLGAQLVSVPNNPNKVQGDRFYQLRYVCIGTKALPQTPDPDNGRVHDRKFVPMEQITEVVKWGKSGAALFKDAIELYKSL